MPYHESIGRRFTDSAEILSPPDPASQVANLIRNPDGSLTIQPVQLLGTDTLSVPVEAATVFSAKAGEVLSHAQTSPGLGLRVSYLDSAGETDVNTIEWLEDAQRARITSGSTANYQDHNLGSLEALVSALAALSA